jgi:proline iminopeptidase
MGSRSATPRAVGEGFRRACRARPILAYTVLVAAISAVFFALTQLVPGSSSPEQFPGFLLWLPMVWSPNIAAIVVARARGELGALWTRSTRVRLPARIWIFAALPVAFAMALAIAATGHNAHWDRLTPLVLLFLLALNLPLGPLGEELGWRGFLQPRLDDRFGPACGALILGAIWALWHLPLWAADSPQAEIPYALFAAHVVCYSVLLSALVRRAQGSVWPAVLLHLLINVAAGAAVIVELSGLSGYFAVTLPGYALAAAWAFWTLRARPGAWPQRAAVGALGGAGGGVAALILTTPQVPPVLDERGRPASGHIASIERPRIGGVDQAVILRGRSDELPVLLFVHGGPGTPETPMLLDFVPELSDYVILAAWEQRGAGMSFSKSLPPESLTIAQMTRDLHEVADWLRTRFDRERIILMAHSWGTLLAVNALAESPERYTAYIGIGQLADPAASEAATYAWLVAEATRRDERRALRVLEAIGPPREGDYLGGYRDRARLGRWIARFGGAIAGRGDLAPYVRSILTTSVYGVGDKLRYLRGERFSLARLWAEMQAFDITRVVQRVEVPIVFVHGRHDWQTPLAPAQAYFERIEAPRKRLVVFDHSAHCPIFEEPDRFLRVLREEVDAIAAAIPPE